jgi:hypothetical protein
MQPLEALVLFGCLAGLAALIWLLALVSTVVVDLAHDEKKSRFDIATRIIEVVVAVFVGGALVCVGSLQYGVYQQQAGIMAEQIKISGRQLDIQAAEQRPWMDIEDASIVKPVTRDTGGLNITLGLTLENYGHAPAIQLYNRAEAISWNPNANEDERRVCNISDQFNTWANDAIFGDQKPHQRAVAVKFPEATLQSQIEAYHRLNGPNSKFIYAAITIVVCIQYKSLFDKETHHHGAVFDLVPLNVTTDPLSFIMSPPGHFSPFTPRIID